MNLFDQIKLAAMAALAVGVLMVGDHAQATPFPSGVCPAIGADSDCATGIVLNSDATATVTNGLGGRGPYDGIEDTLLGVVNNTGGIVNTLTFTGTNIFGFENDGGCTFIACGGGFTNGWHDSTSYAGVTSTGGLETFTITNHNNGTLNFSSGLGIGDTAWFTLEEDVSGANFHIVQVNDQPVTDAPEPASLALLGVGLCGLRLVRRRRA